MSYLIMGYEEMAQSVTTENGDVSAVGISHCK